MFPFFVPFRARNAHLNITRSKWSIEWREREKNQNVSGMFSFYVVFCYALLHYVGIQKPLCAYDDDDDISQCNRSYIHIYGNTLHSRAPCKFVCTLHMQLICGAVSSTCVFVRARLFFNVCNVQLYVHVLYTSLHTKRSRCFFHSLFGSLRFILSFFVSVF